MKKPKPKRGRPTKLTPQLSRAIVKAIRSGSYIEEAAEAVGVSRQLVYQWFERGRAGKSPEHVAFLDAVTRARAADAVESMELISRAAKSRAGALEFKAAAWKLERKLPAKFGPKVRITVVEELTGFLEELRHVLPGEWFEKVLEVAARRGGGADAPSVPIFEADAEAPALVDAVVDANSAAGGEGVRETTAPPAPPDGARSDSSG